MRYVRGFGRGRIAIALQIVAMLMLLCLPHMPLLSRALGAHMRSGGCAMDHRICGCSPERIASRTCCCFRNMKAHAPSVKPRQCPLQSHSSHDGPDLDEAVVDDIATSHTSHRLASPPCGTGPQMISHTAGELKYLRLTWAQLPALRSEPCCPPVRGDGYVSPSLEPPDPPPNIVSAL